MRARDLMIMNIRQVRENGPGGSVGERIGLSNQQDGSRGLPTAAHWPGSRARYRIIAGARRYDTGDLSRTCDRPRESLLMRDARLV